MTAKINFTADEWKVLADAPLVVGGAIAAASPGDIVGAVKEGIAIINAMMSAAQRHPNSQLIREVVPKGVSREQIDLWVKFVRTMMQQSEPARLRAVCVETCQKVAMILHSKADPQEADEFKRWLLEIGEGVANAANEARNVGVNVSPQEAELLSTIASALGVTHIPSPPSAQSYHYP
ncbi:MAG: hypothetical protein E6J34_20565 [Chloroflexi bacterium]|nr:MAG: hypothetical protein E6J34_20565 [Chloroflexota bacterium]